MATRSIQKRSDARVKKLRLIRDGKDRDYIFAEGARLLEELLKSGILLTSIFYVRDKEKVISSLLKEFPPAQPFSLNVMSPPVMEFVSDVTTPPGIVTIARKAEFQKPKRENGATPLILVLNGLQLPQNVGALMRTAEAAGVTEVWFTSHSADPYNPKALRSSAGSAFRLPIRFFPDLSGAAQKLQLEGIRVFGASQAGKKNYDEVDWTPPSALVVSREGGGFSELEMKEVKNTVKIPMLGQVESLNVGVAAGICLFEANKQRRS